MASAKHYIAYEQEHFRELSDAESYGFNISEPDSANLDDETMHELVRPDDHNKMRHTD